jgi:hypothetical protein
MRNAEALADGRERQPFDIPEMDNHCAALFPIFHEILELCIVSNYNHEATGTIHWGTKLLHLPHVRRTPDLCGSGHSSCCYTAFTYAQECSWGVDEGKAVR